MQKMRLSVMEFGRFTKMAQQPNARRARSPGTSAYSHYAPPHRPPPPAAIPAVPHPRRGLCPSRAVRPTSARWPPQSIRGFTIAVSRASFHNPANSGSVYTFPRLG